MKDVIIKTPQQIAHIREAGKYLTELLELIRTHTRPWVMGIELEQRAQVFIDQHGLQGAFKGYNQFPANLCLSINDCLVHGIPDDTMLQEGDLVKVDAGIIYQQGIADAAISIIVGWPRTNPQADALVQATKWALDSGLTHVQPGISLYAFGNHVFTHLHKKWFQVIKHLTGHGVGTAVHEAPHIYNWPHPPTRQQYFQQDMVVALEPITSIKSHDFVEDPENGRNLYTEKGDLGAQREYTVHITDNGPEILAGVTEYK